MGWLGSLVTFALLVLASCENDKPAVRTPRVSEQAGFQCNKDGWCWEHPAPNGNDLYAVWGTDDGSLVVAVGEHGTIVERVDGAWRQLSMDTPLDIFAVHGWPSGEAIAVGENGLVLHRESNGAWRARTSGTDEDLSHVWGRSPTDVTASSGIHWDGSQWEKLIPAAYKWTLDASLAAMATYDDPPDLKDLETRLTDADYEMFPGPVCQGEDGIWFIGDIWQTGKRGFRAKFFPETEWYWLVHANGQEWTAQLLPDISEEVQFPEYDGWPLYCSPRGGPIVLAYTREKEDWSARTEPTFYRMRDGRLVNDDEVDDLSVSQLIGAVDFEHWCRSEPTARWTRAQRARDVLCAARSQRNFGDAVWISAAATEGVIVGDEGSVLEYGREGWTQVFPKSTAYGKLLPSSPYSGHIRLETNRDGYSGESVRPASWSLLPGLWASNDGTAYVAYDTKVLKRTAPGEWESIYEDNSHTEIPGTVASSLYAAVLTSIWGFSNDELYVSNSAGFVSRYDGKNWTREFADAQTSITAIWGSGNDVWASGADLSSTMTFRAAACRQGTPCLFRREGRMFSAHRALLLHRVDGVWRRVDLPDSLPTLSSVWASGPSDVYVGTLGAGLWHFDGSRWSRRILQRSAPDRQDLSPRAFGPVDNEHRYRSPDFVHAIRGISNGQLFVQASPHGYTNHNGRMLFVIQDGKSESIPTDCLVEHGGIQAHGDRVLAPMGHCGIAELQGEIRTRYRALGDVKKVWAGEQYDYAVSDEGHFWFRKHSHGH